MRDSYYLLLCHFNIASCKAPVDVDFIEAEPAPFSPHDAIVVGQSQESTSSINVSWKKKKDEEEKELLVHESITTYHLMLPR